MRFFVAADDIRFNELLLRLPKHRLTRFADELPEGRCDAVFDFLLDELPQRLSLYASLKDVLVFGSAVKSSLAKMVFDHGGNLGCRLAGINALPGFLGLPKWEVSLLKASDREFAGAFLGRAGIDAVFVADQTGMVTPRILCMIINEACFALQEGTASIADIDRAMKLGTNYPHGPFEWADKIGIKNVYETLNAVHQATGDPRYRVCELLRRKYMAGEGFAG